ncbi:MAG: hypothetical protein ACLQBX_03350 [Candidatus Limnocylindrales bacterium]|jgi:hypothetical protein
MTVIGSSGAIHLGWHTSSDATGPPVIGGGAVWSVDIGAGQLLAVSAVTGAVIARIGVGPLPHFASPTLWDGLVLVGTMRGVAAIGAGS